MNAQEFENTVHLSHPHKWMVKDYSFISHEELVFAMDTYGETLLPLPDKHKLASHAFNVTHGFVFKDTDGLFGANSPTNRINISHPHPYNDRGVTLGSTLNSEIPKCICGSKSVGSNKT